MNVLIDTHIALWAVTEDEKLTEKARSVLLTLDNSIYRQNCVILD